MGPWDCPTQLLYSLTLVQSKSHSPIVRPTVYTMELWDCPTVIIQSYTLQPESYSSIVL